jgi:hypothetical protein
MKNIEVTYDALICENGTYEQGEAAFILPMTDELAALERDLLNLVNGSRIKRARDRGLLRCAAATLHKVRRQLLDDADRVALCERCMNPHVLKDQDELDDVCAQCPLEKTAG